MKKARLEKRLSHILSHYLATHLERDAAAPPLITIQAIDLSPHLDCVRVGLSFISLETPFDAEVFLEKKIQPHTWRIKREIAQTLRHAIRRVPRELLFYVDHTPTKAAALEALLQKVAPPQKARTS